MVSTGIGRRGGGGRRKNAVDKNRRETADRVASEVPTDYVGRTCHPTRTNVPQTAAAAFKVLVLCLGFPVLSCRSWSYYFTLLLYCLVFVGHNSTRVDEGRKS